MRTFLIDLRRAFCRTPQVDPKKKADPTPKDQKFEGEG